MKYIFIIFSIIGLASVLALVTLWPQTPEIVEADAVVTINERTLTRRDLQDYKENLPIHDSNEEFIEKLITKQLLIAEAQKREIDKEPDFRKALKTFYEHSLIKILMERVNQEIKITVEDAEIEQYLQLYGKTVHFYTLQTHEMKDENEIITSGTKYLTLFDDLSAPLQRSLSTLKPGETAITSITSNEQIAIYLKDITGKSTLPDNIDKDMIRQQLLQEKIEKELDIWMGELRKQASITFHNTQE